MPNLLLIFVLLFSFNVRSIAQATSVNELDQLFRKETKHKLTRLKPGSRDELLLVYIFKADKRIFSVMKREIYKSNNKIDSAIAYQFGYVNDTLLRVWFTRAERISKKNGVIIAYISNEKIIAVKKTGDIYLPDVKRLKEKSEQLTIMAKELVNTSN